MTSVTTINLYSMVIDYITYKHSKHVSDWLACNKLSLGIDKTKYIVFSLEISFEYCLKETIARYWNSQFLKIDFFHSYTHYDLQCIDIISVKPLLNVLETDSDLLFGLEKWFG